MLYDKIQLYNDSDDVFIETYCADKISARKSDAVLIIPGGGYSEICSDREGEPIAFNLLANGFNCFVLHYSTGKNAVFPKPLIEASLAMKFIKDNADKYNINPERVFAMGFSAGGHLCAALGTMWHTDEIYKQISIPFGYNKPTGILTIYPVISCLIEKTHMPSFYNILGTTTPSYEQRKSCSLETYVDTNTVPTFIVHGFADKLVPVKNALVFADALSNNNIPFEMHIYPNAPHGFALASKVTGWSDKLVADWINKAIAWMDNL